MVILALTAATVIAADQVVKLVLLRWGRFDVLRLGPFAGLRVISSAIWARRYSDRWLSMSALWILCAGALVAGTAWLPLSQILVGLLLGGSLSNALENSLRGSVTDYLCLRFWPTFNLADVALAAGGVGIAVELLKVISAAAT